MIRPMSAIRAARRVFGDERGSTMLGFGMLAPVLVMVTAGVIEFSIMMLEHGRATEATRRAARMAAMYDSIADLEDIAIAPVACTSGGGGVSCGAATVEASATFDAMVTEMQRFLPKLLPENLKVVYTDTGIGSAESGGIKPLVTVTLEALDYSFVMLHAVPGIPDKITLPAFETSQVAKSYIAP